MELVAVYGSLLKGLYNHNNYLGEAEYLGEFDTLPLFTMYDFGNFPGVIMEGNTSIRMEVYKVTNDELRDINRLEGYAEKSPKGGLYDRIKIKTPYGKAYMYVKNTVSKAIPVVADGDWKDYITNIKKQNKTPWVL